MCYANIVTCDAYIVKCYANIVNCDVILCDATCGSVTQLVVLSMLFFFFGAKSIRGTFSCRNRSAIHETERTS